MLLQLLILVFPLKVAVTVGVRYFSRSTHCSWETQNLCVRLETHLYRIVSAGVGCSGSRLMISYVDWMLTNMSFLSSVDYVAGTFDADVSRIPLLSTDDIGDGNDTILDKGTTTHDPRTYDQGARDFTQPVRVTYISRHKNTKDRKLTNEKELLELIATLGYGRDGRTSIALRYTLCVVFRIWDVISAQMAVFLQTQSIY